MARYIVRRILQFIPVFLGVTIIMFLLQNVVPGDPIKLIAGDKAMSPEAEMAIRADHGLVLTDDDGKPIIDEQTGEPIPTPLWQQYVNYLTGLLHGDLGTSYKRSLPVTDILLQKYPYTVRLALVGIVIEAIIGIAAGMISAIKRGSFLDTLVTLSTSILVAMPAFWLGMLLQLFFGVLCKEWTGGAFYLPISFNANGEFQSWVYYILPAVTLASVSTAYTSRIMRSQLLEVMNQDYIRTARAKGLSRKAVIWRHALKNALIPVVTYIGIDFGVMLSGAILTETVFNWPGIGNEIYLAISQRDWPIVMGGVTVIVVVVMIINLLVDISYAFLDPRIRLGSSNNEN